jgi:hypothetical protein
MRSVLYALAILVLGSTLSVAQTTSQQNSPAPNTTAGTYSGNTPANTPQKDGTISNVPNTGAGSTETPREHNWGWIGILGLAGLAGLRNRNREAGTTSPRAAT